MKIHTVTKFSFEAQHLLEGEEGSEGEMHAHTWHGEVHCEGSDNDLDLGSLVNFRNIKAHVRRCNHLCLNEYLKTMGYAEEYHARPTTERIAMLFLKGIPRAVKIVLWESPGNRVEVTHS